jgi:O-antigen/teichoic acid export membrane protein
MDERYRTAVLSTLANTFSKALAFLLMMASMAFTLGYLGAERFGVWMTVAALSALLGFLDLGIADSLRNSVSGAAARNDHARLRELVSNGLLLLCAAGTLIGFGLAALAWLAPWPALVKLEDAALYPEVHRSATVFAALFAVGIPLSGVQRVFHGLQQGYLVHAVSVAASCISLLLLFPLARSEAGIPALILATYGLQVLAPLALLPLLARRGLIGFSTARFRGDASLLLSAGALFFALQVGWMIGWGSDRLIVSALLGAKEVAVLAVAAQLFQLAIQPAAFANGPLWSAYAEAAEQSDQRFIRKTLAYSVSLTFLVAVCCSTLLVLAHRPLLHWWIGPELVIPFGLVLAFAALSIFQSVGNAFAMYLNGTGILRPQLHVVLLFCMLAIPLKLFLTPLAGTAGVVLASVVAYALAVALPYATVYRYTWATS